MNVRRHMIQASISCLLFAMTVLQSNSAIAHCDGMDGPVVTAAKQALAASDVDLALAWVQPEDEAEVRKAFQHALAVRKLGREAQELADRYFFETLVRLHRAGEGAPYTGLKPAGRDLGPAIPLADEALATGRIEPLVELITHESHTGLVARFEQARKAKAAAGNDVAAGREYVHAYVEFIHYAERAHEAATRAASGHAAAEPHAGEGHD